MLFNKKITFIIIYLVLFTYKGLSQWSFHSHFPKTSTIIDITIGEAGKVYVLTTDRKIYYSADNGNTWMLFIQSPDFLNILGIEASKVSNRLFAKTSCCGVAYTDNFGDSWFWDNLFTNPTTGFGLEPNDIDVFDTKVAAITKRILSNFTVLNELYISNNNGENSTWNLSHTFTGNFSVKNVFLLNNNLCFVSSELLPNFPPNTTTLRKSIDGGISFSDIPYFNDKHIADLLITPSLTIYCATNTTNTGEIHKSDDMGNTWIPITFPASNAKITKIAYDTSNDYLYVLTEDGIYRKTTNGNWNHILTDDNLQAIAINNLQEILTGGIQVIGIKKSPDNPINFENIQIGGDETPKWMEITENYIFIGNENNPLISKSEINSPNNWQYRAIQNVDLSVEDIANGKTIGSFNAHRKTNGDILISGSNYIANMEQNMGFTIISDENSGAPLAPLTFPSFIPKNFKLSNNDEILLKQPGANYIDYSPDGSNWNILNPISGQNTKIIIDFCAGKNHYYILTQDFAQISGYELYYSNDRINWTSIALPVNTVGKKIFVDNDDTLYLLVSSPLTLYRLNLANEQWIATNLDLYNDPNTYFELAFDNNNVMYALNFRTTTINSNSQGIAYSIDQGLSWTSINFPVANGNTVYLENIVFDNNGNAYAKTSKTHNFPGITQGIYKYQSVLNTPEINETTVKIYPNPTSKILNIFIQKSGNYLIYDLSGKIILSGIISKGNNKIAIPKNISSGIYLLKIQTDKAHFAKKIIVK